MNTMGDADNTMSIVALIFAFLFPFVGLILAIVAKKKEGENALNKWALILSVIFIIIWIIAIVAGTLIPLLFMGGILGGMGMYF